MTGTTRSAARLFATVTFAVGVFLSSSATADNPQFGRCDKNRACNDEIAAACGSPPSMTCAKNVTDQCKAFLCTCTGEAGLPTCPVGATTTTSSTTTSTSSTTTTSTSSTTTTTQAPIQCCIQSSPMGAFSCVVESAAQCFVD